MKGKRMVSRRTFLEYDGHDVTDMATVVADYDEGCQVLISATMCNSVQLPEVIRGHTATIEFDPRPHAGFAVMPQEEVQKKGESRPAPPGANQGEGGDTFKPQQPREDTRALWEHYIECMHSATPTRSARPTWAMRRSRRSTWASSRTARARPSTLTRIPAKLSRPTVPGQPDGKSVASSAQAQPGHRLEGRRYRLIARASQLPEARR